jgi:acetyltransferase-like isoleucine patch superfamily enzyme
MQNFFYDSRKLENLKNIYIELPCAIHEQIDLPNNINIGAYSIIHKFGMVYENIKIGRYCSIAPRVSIAAPSHPSDWLSTNIFQYLKDWCGKKNDISQPIDYIEKSNRTRITTIIEDDVLIYSNSIICAGVKIGTGAIICANTVITKDVPPFAVVAGNPNKIIQYRFEQNVIDKILESKWWEYDLEKIKDKIDWNNPLVALEQIKNKKLEKFYPQVISK